ncbi:GntR family transcriptional regulator [Ancylobacter defluvii]|uniref:GntR family transcriptional regulator n=1 Tax=Ancylobacter defluvii TaxID=1282440 RepID=A0A9W6JZ33_9HYPH|nr:GntR family transcriptional regulator [Ancylobacter defluvii]MBS7589527.1 GntR family transcriptional regulator [Ancylobacter defluvii]GLK85143.1 GntR family transcriptional regulator [Ancylobacter defluvii]
MADERQTRTEKLAGEIADAIIDGSLEPGTRLDEHMLAARYGTSRTPVREALRKLATTGLIELRPRRGAIVTEVTSQQLETLFVAMGELEATCARLSALSMTPIERRRLGALYDGMADMVARDDVEAYAAANTHFHTLFYAGSHNPVLADMTATLRRRLAPFRHAQFRAPGRLALSHSEHGAVLRAVLAGDAASAHAAMLHHVSLVEDAFEQLAAPSSSRRRAN